MKSANKLGALALSLVLPAVLNAQSAPKFGGLMQVWYNQVMDNNLRNNSVANYYNLRSEFKEDGFAFRRMEISVTGNILPGIDYKVVIDPSINTTSASTTNSNSSYNPTILQDAFMTYKVDAFQLNLGEMKTLQTYEGNISSADLLFAERSQLGRVFGDKRDRGAYASYQFGSAKEGFGAKVTGGVFNGMSDLASGKANDNNAQKDWVVRVDFNLDSAHKFGAYTLQGETDQSDKTGGLIARSFAGTGAPAASTVLGNKDKTTNYGAFYVFEQGPWHFDGEFITGLLGRRNASVTNTAGGGAALREGLDQKFQGYYLTGAYKAGASTFLLRYDYLNYNSNSNWYGSNPYVTAATDYTPKFKETTLGYTYAFDPKLVKSANFKLNYIIRSKNFLKPLAAAGQTSEQGGNTLLAAFQVAF
jgi:hypothetical protein